MVQKLIQFFEMDKINGPRQPLGKIPNQIIEEDQKYENSPEAQRKKLKNDGIKRRSMTTTPTIADNNHS